MQLCCCTPPTLIAVGSRQERREKQHGPSQAFSTAVDSERIPTVFCWKYGGRDVCVYCSATGWKAKLPLKKRCVRWPTHPCHTLPYSPFCKLLCASLVAHMVCLQYRNGFIQCKPALREGARVPHFSSCLLTSAIMETFQPPLNCQKADTSTSSLLMESGGMTLML